MPSNWLRILEVTVICISYSNLRIKENNLYDSVNFHCFLILFFPLKIIQNTITIFFNCLLVILNDHANITTVLIREAFVHWKDVRLTMLGSSFPNVPIFSGELRFYHWQQTLLLFSLKCQAPLIHF